MYGETWVRCNRPRVAGELNEVVASCQGLNHKEHAKFIVKACNSYEGLREALRRLVGEVNAFHFGAERQTGINGIADALQQAEQALKDTE